MVSMPQFGRKSRRHDSEKEDYHKQQHLEEWQIHRATSARRIADIVTCVLLVLAMVFLILVEIGNINNKPVIRDTWFIRLNLTNVVASSVENSQLLNSFARTIGVHDFYTVGLWNFCEGYNDVGITYCSPTMARYWFNPVAIIQNELLQGVTLVLPSDLSYALNLIHVASKWMFVFFMVASCLTFSLIFLLWITLYSRWWSFFIAFWTLINLLFVGVASAIAQAMFTIMKNKFATASQDVNITSDLGWNMLAFAWTATGLALFAFLIQFCLICCGASRRDVKTGRRKGSLKAYESS